MSKKRVAVTLRKPQASADIETFVSSEPADTAQPAAASVPAPAAAPQANVAQSTITHAARSFREVTVYLPAELVQSLARYCLERNLDMNRVLADALGKHLNEAAPSPAPSQATWQSLFETLLRDYRDKLSQLWAVGRARRTPSGQAS